MHVWHVRSVLHTFAAAELICKVASITRAAIAIAWLELGMVSSTVKGVFLCTRLRL